MIDFDIGTIVEKAVVLLDEANYAVLKGDLLKSYLIMENSH